MRHEKKVEQLRRLPESELRTRVLLPLMGALGFADAHEFHGANEHGKDLLFREASRLGEIFVHAAVVSTKDITGKVGDAKSAERILDQVRQALEEPYVDVYRGRQMSVDRCWVITSGRVRPTAMASIAGHLQRSHLDKLVRFIDGVRLVALLDQAYPQYWERSAEFAYYTRHEQIDISSNSLDPPYDNEVDDLAHGGSLLDSVYAIKKAASAVLLNIDFEVLRKLAAMLRSSHPWEIISAWEELDLDISHNGSVYIGRETEVIRKHWNNLVEDLREYEARFDIAPAARRIPKKEPWEV